MTYPEALAKIREEADAETETGLQAIDPQDHDAVLDLILELGTRLTCLEKRQAAFAVAVPAPGVASEALGLKAEAERLLPQTGDRP